MANRIDLVRHPDKTGDAEGIYLGKDAEITPKGWSEAEVVVQRLVRLPHEAILTSKIERAIKLAEMYAKRLNHRKEVEKHEFFNEIDKPQWLIGLHRQDPIHVEVTSIIRECFDSGRLPSLTPSLQAEIRERLGIELPLRIAVKGRKGIEKEMRKIFSHFNSLPVTASLVVTHAKRIAAIVHWVNHNQRTLKGFYETTDRNLLLDTTGITTLIRQPDRKTGRTRWHIASVNDTSHYEEAKHQEFVDILHKIPE